MKFLPKVAVGMGRKCEDIIPFLSGRNCLARVDETTQLSVNGLCWSRVVEGMQELGSESQVGWLSSSTSGSEANFMGRLSNLTTLSISCVGSGKLTGDGEVAEGYRALNSICYDKSLVGQRSCSSVTLSCGEKTSWPTSFHKLRSQVSGL